MEISKAPVAICAVPDS